MKPLAESRVITLPEGRVRVYERQPPIPPTLALLLEGGRDRTGRPWLPLRVVTRNSLHLRGARSECVREDHRLTTWVEGFQTGSDGVARFLLLQACADCGAVCVRDRSFDSLDQHDPQRRGSARPSRLAPRRRNHVLGWYTGARPRQRQYT